MAKYQKYAEYKDSGTDWLGEIPTHWDVQPTKRFFRLIAEPAPENNDYELLSVYTEIGVKPRKELEQKGNKASTTDGYWLVKKGDIVVNKLLAWMGAVGYSEYDGVTSPAYDILRPTKKLNPKFYHYLFRTKIANMEFKRWSRGIMEMRLRLYFDELGRIAMPFPTFKEQNEIVNFLDHETAKIDSLIAKQEKLIELLKEKRQAVISHAVTKGLNPDVAMKDSGVEWLGEVPEHWILSKLKWRAVTTSGSTPSTSKYELYYEDGSIPWIRTTDLNNDDLYETPLSITPRGVSDTACSVLPVNSILIAMYGGAGSIGKHSLLKFESTINQAVCGVLPSKYFNSDYLHRFYEFYRPFWMIGASGTRKDPNIGQDHIKEALVPLPPLEEQVLIANFITEMQTRYDAITQKAELAIQLMQERRTALISSVVTGKINVSNWQHPNEAKTEFGA
ncbi:restriction endonuclease subunit S [Acinetobacter lwoffii]|jgi:type I restriction enzyme S subunit|uniref:restriction endonuclease subunit S n=1 Tax=Acinetobacter lwoffii TaxID=28090 RepID=UPI003D6B3253